jgi:hypothetical protein
MRRERADAIRAKGFGYCFWRYGLLGFALPIAVLWPLLKQVLQFGFSGFSAVEYLRDFLIHLLVVPFESIAFAALTWVHVLNESTDNESR